MGSLISKFTSLLAKEPWKSFKKLGITNGDNILTAEGKDLYIQWSFEKDADKFNEEVAAPLYIQWSCEKEVAAPLIKEQEAEKK